MVISINHNLGSKEAKKRIDHLLNQLIQKDFPAGVKIKSPEKNWYGQTMDFSFKAKKGLFGTTIEGTVKVLEDKIILNSEIPGMVTTFVSEDTIKSVIEKEARELLS